MSTIIGSALLKTLGLALPIAAMALISGGLTMSDGRVRAAGSDAAATPNAAMSNAAAVPAPAAAPSAEEAGVRVALDAYLDGHAAGRPDSFRRAFHPEARMLFMRDGAFSKVEIPDYIARATGKPAADEAQRKRSIDSIDIVGDAAIARITLDYPDVKFTDYMTLLKVGNEWRIVSKVFSADRRPAAQRKAS